MARRGEITVTIKVRTTVSFWDAVKLRLSGVGYAVKQYIEIENDRSDDDAVERDRFLS
jgi:hypothetical protein